MKHLIIAGLALGLVGPALANAQLAEAKQCVQCHKGNEAFAGPSFHAIAQKWKGKKDAVQQLATTIRGGSNATGGPHWDVAKMPDTAERPEVSRSEARTLARWVLKQ